MKKMVSLVFAFTLFTAAHSAFADHWYCSSNNDWFGNSVCTVKSVLVRNNPNNIWIYISIDGNSTCDLLLIKGVSDEQAKAVEALGLTALTSGKKIRFRQNANPTTNDGYTYCYSDQVAIGDF
jgi:hypothetical protein